MPRDTSLHLLQEHNGTPIVCNHSAQHAVRLCTCAQHPTIPSLHHLPQCARALSSTTPHPAARQLLPAPSRVVTLPLPPIGSFSATRSHSTARLAQPASYRGIACSLATVGQQSLPSSKSQRPNPRSLRQPLCTAALVVQRPTSVRAHGSRRTRPPYSYSDGLMTSSILRIILHTCRACDQTAGIVCR